MASFPSRSAPARAFDDLVRDLRRGAVCLYGTPEEDPYARTAADAAALRACLKREGVASVAMLMHRTHLRSTRLRALLKQDIALGEVVAWRDDRSGNCRMLYALAPRGAVARPGRHA